MKAILKTTTFILIIAISACSSSGKKTETNLYYRFSEAEITTMGNYSIEIKRPTALGIIGNRPMVAASMDGVLQQMGHSFWLDSPKVLLFNYLKNVFIESKTKKSTLILQTNILQLEKQQNMALVAIKFIVKDHEHNLVFNKTYKINKQSDSNSINDFAKAINVVLKDILQQLVKDIK